MAARSSTVSSLVASPNRRRPAFPRIQVAVWNRCAVVDRSRSAHGKSRQASSSEAGASSCGPVVEAHEKGGKRHDVPAHHRAVADLDAYVEVAAIEEPKEALFQSMDPAGRRLTGRALERRLVPAMIKRRAAVAGLPPSTCCHTFRVTGITAYLSNGGTPEHAQQIAGHASPKTTKLYDRTADTVVLIRRQPQSSVRTRLRPPNTVRSPLLFWSQNSKSSLVRVDALRHHCRIIYPPDGTSNEPLAG